MLPFDIRHIVVCHVQKKLFTIKNSPFFLAHPVQLELDQYVPQAPISRSSGPMRWSAQHKPSYPILSSVAQTMLCMPAIFVASKRVFQSWRRHLVQKKYAGAVKSRHCHFSDGQSVTVASLFGR